MLATFYHHPPKYKGPNWCELDLTAFQAVQKCLDAFRPDVIIHAAANSDLDECEKNPQAAEKINVVATKFLAQTAEAFGVRFIFVSSDMVFDGKTGFYSENDPVSPLAVYGKNKIDAEKSVHLSCKNHVIARTALIYGRPLGGGSSFSNWMEMRLRKNQTVPLYTDQFRTPIYVENLAEMLLELAQSDFVGTLHLGGANRIDRYNFGLQLCSLGGYNSRLLQKTSMHDFQPLAPRPADVSFSIDKAKSVLTTKMLSTEGGLLRMFEND